MLILNAGGLQIHPNKSKSARMAMLTKVLSNY